MQLVLRVSMIEFNWNRMPKKYTDETVQVSFLFSQAAWTFGQTIFMDAYNSKLRGLENFVLQKLNSSNTRLIEINGKALSNPVRSRINSVFLNVASLVSTQS